MAKKNKCAKELYDLINKKDNDRNYVYPEYEAQRELTQSDLNKLESQLRAMSDKIMKGDPSLTPAEARLKVFDVKMDDLNTLVENYKKRVQKNILTKNAIDVIQMASKANSDPDDREKYIHNGLHQQIMAPLHPYYIEKKKSKDQCAKCGHQIQGGFSFCPSCGSKL